MARVMFSGRYDTVCEHLAELSRAGERCAWPAHGLVGRPFRFSKLAPGTGISLSDFHCLQQPEIFQHLPRAPHHAAEGIVGDHNRQASVFSNATIEVLE
jgi:hypothetical protein